MDSLETFLQSVMTDMKATLPQYEPLRPRGQPIPFFGDIRNATVLTVGVNPSSTVFEDWGRPDEIDEMTAYDLDNRLQNYFVSGQHEWFDTWEKAFEPLGLSYKAGKAHLAAHLDLSPRVTISMRGAKNSGNEHLFKVMVEQDIKWFFQLLKQCHQTRLLLFAGCMADRYINDFVRRVAPVHGFHLEGSLTLKKGNAKTGFYNLRSNSSDEFYVFFCSVSPSDNEERRPLLIQRVQENKKTLLALLNEQPTATSG